MLMFTARPRPNRWTRVAGVAFVLTTVAGGMVDGTLGADAAPPDHAKGGGGETTDEKCHPKKGCTEPTTEPTSEPTAEPTTEPTTEPTSEPTTEATPEPTSEPTTEPTSEPTTEPVADEGLTVSSSPLVDPTADRNLQHMGQGAATSSGDAAVVLTTTKDQVRPRLTVRRDNGEMWHVPLPYDTTYGFENAVYTIDRDNRLHVLGGVLEMVHRRYQLTGTPPTAAALLDTRVYGDMDSRPGAIVALASGGVVATWHQQGETTAQGHTLLHVTSANERQVQELAFIPTRASKSALVQHPVDGSVWLFANPDGFGSIGAARMTMTSAGLSVAAADPYFFSSSDGMGAPDPENPRLYAAADPASGDVVVAYQGGGDRTMFTTSSGRTSYSTNIVVARMGADGASTFAHTPSRTERIASFGMSVAGGTVHVTHPVVLPDGSFDSLRMARLTGDTWSEQDLGRLVVGYERVAAVPGRPESVARLTTDVPTLFAAR